MASSLLFAWNALDGKLSLAALIGQLNIRMAQLQQILSPPAYTTKTAAYTATAVDFQINADPTAGGFTVTLPTSGIPAGKTYRIKHSSASGNSVTVQPATGQIDLAASKVLASLQSADVQWDGSAWWIL
jgi:hypothetical protein